MIYLRLQDEPWTNARASEVKRAFPFLTIPCLWRNRYALLQNSRRLTRPLKFGEIKGAIRKINFGPTIAPQSVDSRHAYEHWKGRIAMGVQKQFPALFGYYFVRQVQKKSKARRFAVVIGIEGLENRALCFRGSDIYLDVVFAIPH